MSTALPRVRAGNSDLREKIDEAKRLLPMPKVLEKLELGAHAKKSTHCPFHEDEHNSFSVFHGNDGKGWQWKCHSGCGYGDEIALLMKVNGINRREAITLYLEMAGFLPSAPRSRESPKSRESPQSHGSPESHEYPESPESPASPQYPECHESHVYPVSPVSNGQGLDGEKEKVLKALAAPLGSGLDPGLNLIWDLVASGAWDW